MKPLKIILLSALFAMFAISCGDDPTDPMVIETPVISSIAPESIHSGDNFIVTGEYFGENQQQYAGKLMIGNIPANIINWSATKIEASISDIEAGDFDVTVLLNAELKSNIVKITILSNDIPLPTQIISVSPDICEIGTEITITGNQFGATQALSYVKIGSISTTNCTDWSNEVIHCIVPDIGETGQYEVSVVAGGVESNKIKIIFNAPMPILPPQIISLTPNSGKVGDTITIKGNNFDATQGTSNVFIGTIKPTDYSGWNNTTIRFIIPVGAISDSVSVTVNGLNSNKYFLNVTDEETPTTPVIISLDKDEYAESGLVKITGTNFGSTKGEIICTPSSLKGTVQTWSDNQIYFLLPFGARSGNIHIIRNDNEQSNKYPYYVKIVDEFPMVLINKGNFTMGNNSGEENAKPAHSVNFTSDIYMATTEVTQKQYTVVTNKKPFPTASWREHCSKLYPFF